ncbi:MAG: hypothetical protein DID91_2727703398 [Candidatus Nitrotoga sp. MKT]|nr:MAG: hypothetical protein DID91_2727703398 [Candidatus Nitrotoga sp. MKT]
MCGSVTSHRDGLYQNHLALWLDLNFAGETTYSGMMLDIPRMCSDTTDTAPNSPIARALHKITPYQQTPFDVGQDDAPKGLPAESAERYRRFFFLFALCLHQRN